MKKNKLIVESLLLSSSTNISSDYTEEINVKKINLARKIGISVSDKISIYEAQDIRDDQNAKVDKMIIDSFDIVTM